MNKTRFARFGVPKTCELFLYKRNRSIVVISDFQDGGPAVQKGRPVAHYEEKWRNLQSHAEAFPVSVENLIVEGGYLERLPLAAIKAGLVDRAEIWSHWLGAEGLPDAVARSGLVHRSFHADGPQAPKASNDMLAYIRVFGPPAILCVWGLGVNEEILEACADSFKIYNSIDAPALRVPPAVSRHFDLVLTGAQWQSDEVAARHPDMRTAVMPIGPEFASDTMFHPLGIEKTHDIVYVAAAQAYKRHDILFDALAKLPRSLKTLCVAGYGELGDDLRRRAGDLQLCVDFIGPPGVPIREVNRLMNQARMGVVCGIDDGAPAILTEYMLADLPVLANSQLRCGLHYITPETGATASAEDFHAGILDVLSRLGDFSPRRVVQSHWTWPHTIGMLRNLFDERTQSAVPAIRQSPGRHP